MIAFERPADFKPWFEVAGCLCEYAGKLLLLKRPQEKSEGGKWGAPGGKIDAGESPKQAVVRELQEETGIILDGSQPITLAQSFFVRTDHQKDLVYHLHRVLFDTQPEVRLNPGEHVEYVWVTLDEAFALPLVHDMEECLHQVYDRLKDEPIQDCLPDAT